MFRDKEPQGELARYAYGYSDKKPGRTFWVPVLFMISVCLWGLFNSVTITW